MGSIFVRSASIALGVVALAGAAHAQVPATDPKPPEAEGDQPVTRKDVLDILDEVLPPIDIGGGIFLWDYEPLIGGRSSHTEVYWAYLTFDVDLPADFDFHLQPMWRDTKLRPFFNSNVWIQQTYLSWSPEEAAYGSLKVGKIYSKFGRFWDGSFYGNVPYFDGHKLDPDLGFSYESTFAFSESSSADVSLQYFPRDGSTNGSLQGRDTLSFPGGVQRDSFVARVAPKLTWGESSSATLGASAMAFEATFGDASLDDDVVRWNVEADLTVDDFNVFGEAAWQRGTHAPGFPTPGVRESDIFWVMSGTSLMVTDWLKLGYNFSLGDYRDSNVRELFHMARTEFHLTAQTQIWIEYVNWIREQAGPDVDVDESINLVFYAYF